ncbi:hypothetical protein FHR32_007259 [Streptosporangium album]|uniref:DUF4158 domain-containing protein n=1 Tax=Streptosporangium album TaxID=47479 RepID=A0A7W7S2Q9_9ACTN|nr:DUF4158 domain-containing protein [Streptosporangium album]MBB4942859.1 hypothetical protein [Streptosporangium album]
MRREWELEDLIERWTLDEAERELLANTSGATRLGFALLLKFFELEARFPRWEDVPTVADEDKLVFWLAAEICPLKMSRDRLRAALLARCREERIEPPRPAPIERLLGAAEAMFERQFTMRTLDRLSAEAVVKLEELIAVDDPDPDGGSGGMRSFLQELKEDPGPLQLETLLAEIVKLERVKATGLPKGCSRGCRRKSWRAGGPGR